MTGGRVKQYSVYIRERKREREKDREREREYGIENVADVMLC